MFSGFIWLRQAAGAGGREIVRCSASRLLGIHWLTTGALSSMFSAAPLHGLIVHVGIGFAVTAAAGRLWFGGALPVAAWAPSSAIGADRRCWRCG